MKLNILVKTKAREEKVEKIDDKNYKVWVKEQAIEGKANLAVIRVLAKHFSVPKRSVRIIVGEKSSKKIVEIVNLN